MHDLYPSYCIALILVLVYKCSLTPLVNFHFRYCTFQLQNFHLILLYSFYSIVGILYRGIIIVATVLLNLNEVSLIP
jgi:hypothetical protein